MFKKLLSFAVAVLLLCGVAYAQPGVVSDGNVTRDNMKISAIDGTAFVDFSAADVLTDYIGSRLIIRDSAGKALIGYIKAAGTGETLGGEEVDAWAHAAYPYDTLDASSPPNIASAIKTQTAQVATAYEEITDYASRQGLLLKVSYSLTLNSGTAPYFGIGNSNIGVARSLDNPHYLTFVHPSTAMRFVGFRNEAANQSNYSIADFVCKQVLTPSATGVTIVSAQGGSTYNWASKDVDFNYYDESGYTYEIYSLARPQIIFW